MLRYPTHGLAGFDLKDLYTAVLGAYGQRLQGRVETTSQTGSVRVMVHSTHRQTRETHLSIGSPANLGYDLVGRDGPEALPPVWRCPVHGYLLVSCCQGNQVHGRAPAHRKDLDRTTDLVRAGKRTM
eukprot:scaffold870_cov393-Prasinococcus_capsulatus_cf.AAC.19